MGITASILSRIPFVSTIYEAYSSSSSPTPIPTRLSEDVGVGLAAFGYGIDADDHLYRRLSQAERELPAVIQDRALRLAWSLYESNPLAHGIIEMMKDHVVGKGFRVISADPEVQAVIDKHWFDHVNDWEIKQHDRVRDLSIFGELILVAFVNKADGHVRLASIDPAHVRGVYSDKDNPEDIQTIVVNPRRNVGGTRDSDKIFRVVHRDEDPESTTYGKWVGMQEGEMFTPPGRNSKAYPYTGSCFYFTINKTSSAMRGRTDLLSIIDWLDAYDQILFNFVDRTLLMNMFVWDVTLNGATESQIKEWHSKHAATPKPGTVNVHNESETWDSVSPSFAAAEFEVQQKTLKGQVLSPLGMPPHWFGEDDANRATAQEMAHPAMKRLESRQLYFRHIVERVIRFQLDQAEIATTLSPPQRSRVFEPAETQISEAVDPDMDMDAMSQPSMTPAQRAEMNRKAAAAKAAAEELHAKQLKADKIRPPEHKFEVAVPEMSAKDITMASNSMMSIAQSLVIAMTAGILDLEEARKIFVLITSELGANINLDAMVDRLTAKGVTEFQGDGSIDKLKGDNDTDDSRSISPKNRAALAKAGGNNDARKKPVVNGEGKPATESEVSEAMAFLVQQIREVLNKEAEGVKNA